MSLTIPSSLRLRLTCLALAFAAQGALFAGTKPDTIIPSDSNFKAHPEWNEGCVERVKAMQGKRCDIIFIGDSITHMWSSVGLKQWDHYYGDRHALNFGAGGDKTQNVLWRLDTWKVHAFHPKVAVVLIGTNNIGFDPPADIATGVKAVISKEQSMYPGIKTILIGILPRAYSPDDAPRVAAANALIRPLADGKSVFFLDVGSHFPREGNTYLGLGPDKLHPSPLGYKIFAETLEPLMARLLGVTPKLPI